MKQLVKLDQEMFHQQRIKYEPESGPVRQSLRGDLSEKISRVKKSNTSVRKSNCRSLIALGSEEMRRPPAAMPILDTI